jgi:hypothetical protein
MKAQSWERFARRACLGFALWVFPAVVRADVPPAPLQAPRGALVVLADALKGALGPIPQGALLVVAPPKSDVALTHAEELSVRIGQVVSGKLGARAHEKSVQLGTARALAGRASSLVFVQPEIEKGELRLVGDVFPVMTNGWERLKNPVPGPSSHAFAHAPIDAEVRAFMPPIALEQGKITKAKHAEGDILAVACGDVDSDGAQEIALVSNAKVVLGRIGLGTSPGSNVFRVEKTALFRELGPRLAVPARESLGGAIVLPAGGHGALLVGTSERGGMALGPDLRLRHMLTGLPVAGSLGCASLVPELGAFDGLRACSTSHPLPGLVAPSALPPRFDAIAELAYVDTRGAPHTAMVTREPSAKLRLRVDGAEVHTVEGAGAQVLLADLDLDGTPELVSTMAEGEDRIVVTTLDRVPKVRLRLDAKEGVRALAACPPEAGARPVLVAAVGQELWLVR